MRCDPHRLKKTAVAPMLTGVAHCVRRVTNARSSGLGLHKVRARGITAGALEVVMHRAVDQVPDLVEACEILVALGVRRVLTSGGASSALEGVEMTAKLVERFGGRMDIMAGGQIRAENVQQILRRTGVGAVHLGPRRRVRGAGMGDRDELDIDQLAAVVRAVHT